MRKPTAKTINVECEYLFENNNFYWEMINNIVKSQEDILKNLPDRKQVERIIDLINSIAEMHTYRENTILNNLTKNITHYQ